MILALLLSLAYYGLDSGYPDPEELLMIDRAYRAMRATGTITENDYGKLTETKVIVVRRVWERIPDLDDKTWLGHNANRSCSQSTATSPNIGCTHGLYRGRVIFILQLDLNLALNAGMPPCQFNSRWFLSLIIHEAHHAAGYDHGPAMTDADNRALNRALSQPDVRHIQHVYDTMRHQFWECQ